MELARSWMLTRNEPMIVDDEEALRRAESVMASVMKSEFTRFSSAMLFDWVSSNFLLNSFWIPAAFGSPSLVIRTAYKRETVWNCYLNWNKDLLKKNLILLENLFLFFKNFIPFTKRWRCLINFQYGHASFPPLTNRVNPCTQNKSEFPSFAGNMNAVGCTKSLKNVCKWCFKSCFSNNLGIVCMNRKC